MTIIFGDDEDNSFDVTSASDADLYIDGGLGADTINILFGDIADVVGEYYGPDSRARFSYYGNAGFAQLDFTHIETVNVTFGDAIDVLRVYNNAVVRFDGGGGDDLFDADFSSSAADIRFTLDETAGALSLFEGQGTVLTNVERVSVTTGSGNDILIGGAGADTFFAHEGFNIIDSGSGDDSIISYGIDDVEGGDGFDSWIGDYSGATAALRLGQGTGNQYLLSNGVDVRNVEAMDLYTGSGDDQFAVALPFGVESGTYMNIRAGGGYDRLNIDWSGGVHAQYGAFGLIGSLSLRNVQTSDQISAESIERIAVRMGQGNDRFELEGGIAEIDGGAGIDHVSANFQWMTDDILFVLNGSAGAISTFVGQGSSLTHVESVGIITGAGNDSLTGGIYDDALEGGAGDDVIEGCDGDDYLRGGDGVDTLSYAGNAMGVTVRLISGITNTIGAGTDNISDFENLHGSAFADALTGDNGRNRIDGGGGADRLNGGAGNDTLYGGDGDDRLIGGKGNDDLRGANGNDVYILDSSADRVTEFEGEGIDTVYASVTFSLVGRFIENLFLAGGGNIDATGDDFDNIIGSNAGNNVLNGGAGIDTASYSSASDGVGISLALSGLQSTGGAGDDMLIGFENLVGSAHADTLSGDGSANIINGGAGADLLTGGKGDDIFYVDNAGDNVVEIGNGGTDIVYSSVSYTLLGRYVESLTLTGAGNNYALGNSKTNTLVGNSGNNVLRGGEGSDLLTGGAGKDTFGFDTALAANNVDRITDFSVADDTIRLSRSVFAAIGANGVLDADAFLIGTKALDAEDRIFYNGSTGGLFYDADGNGAGAAILFARLATGLAMTSADFLVIA